MNYKIKSVFLILVIAAIMVGIGFFTNYEEVTGATVSKTVVCYNNHDCDDGINRTEDICRNPGTEFSLCVNKII